MLLRSIDGAAWNSGQWLNVDRTHLVLARVKLVLTQHYCCKSCLAVLLNIYPGVEAGSTRKIVSFGLVRARKFWTRSISTECLSVSTTEIDQ